MELTLRESAFIRPSGSRNQTFAAGETSRAAGISAETTKEINEGWKPVLSGASSVRAFTGPRGGRGSSSWIPAHETSGLGVALADRKMHTEQKRAVLSGGSALLGAEAGPIPSSLVGKNKTFYDVTSFRTCSMVQTWYDKIPSLKNFNRVTSTMQMFLKLQQEGCQSTSWMDMLPVWMMDDGSMASSLAIINNRANDFAQTRFRGETVGNAGQASRTLNGDNNNIYGGGQIKKSNSSL